MKRNHAILPTALAVIASASILATSCATAPPADATAPSPDAVSVSADSAASSEASSMEDELAGLQADFSAMSQEYDAYRESCEASLAESQAAAESSAAAHKEIVDRIGYETGITFRQLLDAAELFHGMKVKFRGKVLQVIQDSESIQLRLAVDGNTDTVIFGEYDTNNVPLRPAKGAEITVCGTAVGLFSYQSTTGKDHTLPSISIETITQ